MVHVNIQDTVDFNTTMTTNKVLSHSAVPVAISAEIDVDSPYIFV